MLDASAHPNLSLALDLADKGIKLIAVLIGGCWTWWNYAKSRTYKQKLELKITPTVFGKKTLFGDVRIELKNIGGTRHPVQHQGTVCEITAIHDDLTERPIDFQPIFMDRDNVEPGESVSDTVWWRTDIPFEDIVWIKISMRVVSNELEWTDIRLIRADGSD